MDYVRAFFVGGLICVIGQILIDKTSLTPARILSQFCYGRGYSYRGWTIRTNSKFGGAGATVPLPGFGYTLAKGTIKAVNEMGVPGRVYRWCQSGCRRESPQP
jgi:stage V sporulation protein AE